MGAAIMRGLAAEDRENSRFYDISAQITSSLEKELSVKPSSSAGELAAWSDCIVLAVKPGLVGDVLIKIKGFLNDSKLLISAAAGISTGRIEEFTGQGVPVVRAMPNTPALKKLGMTALCRGSFALEEHLAAAEKLFSRVGEVVRVEEKMMDAVTAVSGSGPAYLFYLAEALEKAGVEEGLPADVSRMLTAQTLYGASAMLSGGEADPSELRMRVTSPGGTTQAAVSALERGDFILLIRQAVKMARDRSVEIGNKLSTPE